MDILDQIDGIPLPALVDFLITRRHFITPDLLAKIQENFSINALARLAQSGPGTVKSREDFDLHGEIVEQINAVRSLRNSVLNDRGEITASTREVKEALTTATQMISLLVKSEAEVRNMDRIRQLEIAVTEALKDIDPALQKQVISAMERRVNTHY